MQEDQWHDAINIIVKLGKHHENKDIVVLGAHYDVYPGSLGINDNGCAVVMLLEFIKRNYNRDFDIPIEVVFFDKEETGMIGSRNYVFLNKDRINYSLVFDIIAYGDKLLYGSSNSSFDELFKHIEIFKLNRVLPSDNLSFASARVKTALITAAPDDDLIIKEDGSYDLVDYPTFYSSFHNRENDNCLDKINFKLVELAINELEELLG